MVGAILPRLALCREIMRKECHTVRCSMSVWLDKAQRFAGHCGIIIDSAMRERVEELGAGALDWSLDCSLTSTRSCSRDSLEVGFL
jgi:hypothetical protein